MTEPVSGTPPAPRRPQLLMLAPHEPTLDPRVHYTANALAREYDVTVLSTVQDCERRPGGNYSDAPHYATVRLPYHMQPGKGGGLFMVFELLRLRLARRSRPGGFLSGCYVTLACLAAAALATALGLVALALELLAAAVLGLFHLAGNLVPPLDDYPFVTLMIVRRLARSFLGRVRAMSAEGRQGLRRTLGVFFFTFRVNALFWRNVQARQTKPDVVYCHDLFSLQTAIMLKRLYGCAVVYDSHEYYPFLYPGRAYARLVTWYERLLVREADVYLTVSPQLAEELGRRYGASPVHAIPNVEPQPAQPPQPLGGEMDELAAGRLKVLYQGSFAEGRGLEEVLEEWKGVDAGAAALFLRGPQNDVRDRLEKTAEERELLGRSVYVLKPVLERDLIRAAAEADVGLIPYKGDKRSYRFACPNKLSQYVHAGLAVVGNRIPFVEGMISGSAIGQVYDVQEPGSLAEVIKRLASDPELLRGCRENSRRLSRTDYRWENYEDELLRLVREARPQGRQGGGVEEKELAGAA